MSGLRVRMNNSCATHSSELGVGALRWNSKAAPDTNRMASAFHSTIGSRIVRALRATCVVQARDVPDPATSQPEIRPKSGTALRPNTSISVQRSVSCPVPRKAASAMPLSPVQAWT